jgi:hypothetical protein
MESDRLEVEIMEAWSLTTTRRVSPWWRDTIRRHCVESMRDARLTDEARLRLIKTLGEK